MSARPHLPIPNTVIWRLTDRCDLNCAHCGSHTTLDAAEVQNTDQMFAIADQLIDAKVKRVFLSGGEPLVRDDFKEIAERLLAGEVAISFVSNGNRFDESMATWCHSVGVGAVHFSLDGGKELHDRQRRAPGSFERVVAAIETALDAGLHVAIITVLTRVVLADLEEVHRTITDLGVDHWQVRLAARHRGNALTAPDYLTPKEVPEVVERLIAFKKSPYGPKIVAATSIGYFGNVEKELRGQKEDSWRGCSCGITWCTIEPNGEVKACGNGALTIEGNLASESFLDIWNREGGFAHTRNASLADLGGECRRCDWARLCGGGCLAISFDEGDGREARHCMQHPATGGPRNRPGFVERRRVKKLRESLEAE